MVSIGAGHLSFILFFFISLQLLHFPFHITLLPASSAYHVLLLLLHSACLGINHLHSWISLLVIGPLFIHPCCYYIESKWYKLDLSLLIVFAETCWFSCSCYNTILEYLRASSSRRGWGGAGYHHRLVEREREREQVCTTLETRGPGGAKNEAFVHVCLSVKKGDVCGCGNEW